MNKNKVLIKENFIEKNYLEKLIFWLKNNDSEYIESSRSHLANYNIPHVLYSDFSLLYLKVKNQIECFYNIDLHEEHFCNVVEYAVGQNLPLHTDDESQFENGILLWQAKTSMGHPRRDYSSIVYINDDYEGGEIEFPYLSIKVKPKAGTLIAFPSGNLFSHEAKTVTKGFKWITPTFWCLKD